MHYSYVVIARSSRRVENTPRSTPEAAKLVMDYMAWSAAKSTDMREDIEKG
jgi:hypothetical protein